MCDVNAIENVVLVVGIRRCLWMHVPCEGAVVWRDSDGVAFGGLGVVLSK